MPPFTDEYRYRIMSLLQREPGLSQRELAERLGMSLGKVNFCLRALMEKGLLKANRFYNSRNKRAYLYVLTPSGITERARLTVRFLERKTAEYEALKAEIERISAEVREQEGKVHP
jgi:EPS-associated MarR family transcriptional regulator